MKMFRLMFALILSLFSAGSRTEMSVDSLRGLSTALKPDYQFVSPVLGALYWRHYYIENLWRFGNRESAAVRLIMALFFLHHDDITFDITAYPTNIGTYLDVSHIGKFVGNIIKYRNGELSKPQLIEELKNVINNMKELKQAEIKAKIIEELDKKIREQQERYQIVIDSFKQGLDDKSRRLWDISETSTLQSGRRGARRDLANHLKGTTQGQVFNDIIKMRTGLFTARTDLGAEKSKESIANKFFLRAAGTTDKISLPKMIADAVDEEIDRQKPLYVIYNTINIFLSFLWKKAESKNDFRIFFDEVVNIIGIDRSGFFEDEALLDGQFDASYYRNLKYMPSDRLTLEDYVFLILGYDFYQNLVPREISMLSGVRYEDRGGREYRFPDCVETSLRNFLNALLYDPTSRRFNIDLLRKLEPSQYLLEYYERKYPDQGQIMTRRAHDDWAQVISGLPDVRYRSDVCNVITSISNVQKIFESLFKNVHTFYEFQERLDQAGIKMDIASLHALDDPTYDNQNTIIFTVQKPGMDKFILKWKFQPGHSIFVYPCSVPPSFEIYVSDLFRKFDSSANLFDQATSCALLTVFMGTLREVLSKIDSSSIKNNVRIYKYQALLLQDLSNVEKALQVLLEAKTIIDTELLRSFLENIYRFLPDDFSIQRVYFEIVHKLLPIDVKWEIFDKIFPYGKGEIFAELLLGADVPEDRKEKYYNAAKSIMPNIENDLSKRDLILKIMGESAPHEKEIQLLCILYEVVRETLRTIQESRAFIQIVSGDEFFKGVIIPLEFPTNDRLREVFKQFYEIIAEKLPGMDNQAKSKIIDSIFNIVIPRAEKDFKELLPVLYQIAEKALPSITCGKNDYSFLIACKAILARDIPQDKEQAEMLFPIYKIIDGKIRDECKAYSFIDIIEGWYDGKSGELSRKVGKIPR